MIYWSYTDEDLATARFVYAHSAHANGRIYRFEGLYFIGENWLASSRTPFTVAGAPNPMDLSAAYEDQRTKRFYFVGP